jgi:hypothetical protein
MINRIKNKTTLFRVVTIFVLLFTFVSFAAPVSASSPQYVCFDVVAGLGGLPGTWSSNGLVDSSGTAVFNPFVAGWDSKLGQPATVHDRFVVTDEYGSITFQAQGHSALVVNQYDHTVPGYLATWVIISGTGAYDNLRGQGDGYAWIDWVNGEFLAFQCGQAHYDPQ